MMKAKIKYFFGTKYKLFRSFFIVLFMLILVAAVTNAILKDVETSEDNLFQVGEINLLVDSTCHYYNITGTNSSGFVYTDMGCPQDDGQGNIVGNWTETDLGGHKYFYFNDLKPGDRGENTISFKVVNNDAWGVFEIKDIQNLDNTCPAPEETVEGEPCLEKGELLENMYFKLWLDQGLTPGFQGDDSGEGDNVWQQGEPVAYNGKISEQRQIFNLWETLSETYNNWVCEMYEEEWMAGEPGCEGIMADGRLVQGITYYLGFAWDLPLSAGNEIQTDSLMMDIALNVVQHRNNPTKMGLPMGVPEGLIAYWPFNEEAGSTFEDVSGNSHDGTIFGAEFKSGKVGNALYFDGSDYATVPYDSAFNFANYATGGFTIETWVYVEDTYKPYIMSQFTNVHENNLSYLPLNSHTLWANGESTGSTYASTDGKTYLDWPVPSMGRDSWHHIVSTFKGNLFKKYIDGALITTSSLPGSLANTLDGTPLVLGAKWQGGSTYDFKYEGYIDEMKIYNRALELDEVMANYYGSF